MPLPIDDDASLNPPRTHLGSARIGAMADAVPRLGAAPRWTERREADTPRLLRNPGIVSISRPPPRLPWARYTQTAPDPGYTKAALERGAFGAPRGVIGDAIGRGRDRPAFVRRRLTRR